MITAKKLLKSETKIVHGTNISTEDYCLQKLE